MLYGRPRPEIGRSLILFALDKLATAARGRADSISGAGTRSDLVWPGRPRPGIGRRPILCAQVFVATAARGRAAYIFGARAPYSLALVACARSIVRSRCSPLRIEKATSASTMPTTTK